MDNEMERLKYPVGRFVWPAEVSADELKEAISIIGALPAKLRNVIDGLDERQLNTTYRDGGWTVRQVVHHIADSHMNAMIRFKLALSEDMPTVKPYDETAWGNHIDATTISPEHSLRIIEGVHARWVVLMQNMSEADWNRKYNHPQYGTFELKKVARQYSWHSEHHLGHVMIVINAFSV